MFLAAKRSSILLIFFALSVAAIYIEVVQQLSIKQIYGMINYRPKSVVIRKHEKQKRTQGTKDIWQVVGQHRLHTHIESDASTFTFTADKNKISFYETLHNMKCLIEERKPSSSSDEAITQVRKIHAKKGTYDYSRGSLQADNVTLALYQKHHNESIKPLLEGSADFAIFTFSAQSPTFKAKGFHASILSAD